MSNFTIVQFVRYQKISQIYIVDPWLESYGERYDKQLESTYPSYLVPQVSEVLNIKFAKLGSNPGHVIPKTFPECQY